MDNNGIAVAALCVSVIGTGSAILISLLKKAQSSGVELNRVTSLEFRMGTMEEENKQRGVAMSEYGGFVAGQKVFNETQIGVNRLREERENEFNRRLSTMEGRIGRE